MPPPANGRSCAIWRQSTAASCGRFSRPANWSKARSTKSRRVAATRVAATRLDLVDRAFDQFAGLENLPQLAAVVSAGVTPGKHRGGMEPAARLSAVATRVAATRLD